MPDKIKTREERIKTNEMLIGSITQSLYICDVFGASKVLANLMTEISTDEKDGFISSKEAKDFRLDALKLLDSAEKRCKCFEMPEIF